MRVAAYQAPLLHPGSLDALALIRRRVEQREAEDVAILCCPEAILGGLADHSDDPTRLAVATGRIGSVLAPLASDTVTTIVGFTELADNGRLYNSAAVWHRGVVAGVYRKHHPAIRRSVYAAGADTPVFRVDGLTFGIVICYDSTFAEPAARMAAEGAAVLFVPTNNGLPHSRAAEDIVAQAREADVAGRTSALLSAGSSGIVRPDGTVLCAAPAGAEAMLVAELRHPIRMNRAEELQERPRYTGHLTCLIGRQDIAERGMDRMIRAEVALARNREGWNHVAPRFHGRTALPEYGPLAPTEDSLRLLDTTSNLRALELGCGSGHSLLFLANRGAQELWGIDLSPVQIAFAKETLRPFAPRVRLLESPMEVNPGVPENYFDLVFSIYGLGWTTDLPATMALVSQYLRPDGCFVLSGEHPVYSCLDWSGTQHVVAVPYFAEGPRAHDSWKGAAIVTYHRTLGTFIREVIRAGLQIEALVEPPMDPATVKEEHIDPSRWYSVARAQIMPTTFIIKARKPIRS